MAITAQDADRSGTVTGVRLVVWNCHERFDRNIEYLHELDFDVAVVCECGPFEAPMDTRELASVLKLGIEQPGHTKHIGLLARSPWRVEAMPLVSDQPWVLPVRVRGPIDFTVLAIWALSREFVPGRLSYASQMGRVVSELVPTISGPVIVAGDLNAPIASAPTEVRRHAESVARLEEAGLVSAFTAARGAIDPLTEPTLYHQRKQDRRFHIDHAFVPEDWTAGMSVQIGSYEEWVATRRSDHVPLIVDLPAVPAMVGTAG